MIILVFTGLGLNSDNISILGFRAGLVIEIVKKENTVQSKE